MTTAYYRDPNTNPQMKELCRRYTDHFVQIKMRDGRTYQAIIIDVDVNHITILVPEEFDDNSMNRSDNDERLFGYGFGPRFFRFRRFGLPLAALAGLSLFPFAFPYHPYYPYYPYYQPYPYY